MQIDQPNLWEDDDFVYVPEEFFKYLPKEFHEAAEARKEQGEKALRIAEQDIKHLIKLLNATPTANSISYIYQRLRKAKFEITAESVMEQEMLTTAFIVTYARLFASGDGATGISKKRIPKHLKPFHDDIIDLRNKRYAHNASHGSIKSGVIINFDDDGFKLEAKMELGSYIGGRDEWQDLVTFINAHMHEQLTKILNRLKKKTGYEWTFPSGPVPDWVDNDS